MDAKDLLLTQHAGVHAMTMRGEGRPTLADAAFGKLTDAQMRLRPSPGLNSCAWLRWHIARAEDAFVNVVLFGAAQVLDDDWPKRLGVDRRDIGTGMTPDEVALLSDTIDLVALAEYRNAVGRRTREAVSSMPASGWDGRVDPSDMKRAADAGAFGRATALETFFANWPRAVLLSSITVMHSAQHIGEALTVRSVGGFALGV